MLMATETALKISATQALPTRREAPLAVDVREARRHWGNIGKTSFYSVVKKYEVVLVRLGGRTLVPMSEIERVLTKATIPAPATTDAVPRIEAARALATASVKARRKAAAARRAASPPQKR